MTLLELGKPCNGVLEHVYENLALFAKVLEDVLAGEESCEEAEAESDDIDTEFVEAGVDTIELRCDFRELRPNGCSDPHHNEADEHVDTDSTADVRDSTVDDVADVGDAGLMRGPPVGGIDLEYLECGCTVGLLEFCFLGCAILCDVTESSLLSVLVVFCHSCSPLLGRDVVVSLLPKSNS